MKVEAIVAGAGSGVRLGKKTAKPLISLKGVPIFIRTLKVLSGSALIDKIILVVKKEEMARFAATVKRYKIKKVKAIIPGGKTRTLSVKNGISHLDTDTRLVLIHDAVRPFINGELIRRLIAAAARWGAAIPAVPVKDTVKAVGSDSRVEKTLQRDKLWLVQTPQAFKTEIILKSYKNLKGLAFDDAALVEKLGKPVRVVMGVYHNIKITTPEDLALARAMLAG